MLIVVCSCRGNFCLSFKFIQAETKSQTSALSAISNTTNESECELKINLTDVRGFSNKNSINNKKKKKKTKT